MGVDIFVKRWIDWFRISEAIQYVKKPCRFHKVSEAHFVKLFNENRYIQIGGKSPYLEVLEFT